jgi:hypothetical protein
MRIRLLRDYPASIGKISSVEYTVDQHCYAPEQAVRVINIGNKGDNRKRHNTGDNAQLDR